MNERRMAYVLAATLGLLAAPVCADDDRQQMQAMSSQLGLISPEDATVSALAAKPGVVTDAELDDRDFGKGWDYEFEIADSDGKEWEVTIDAQNGKVRQVSRDWF